MREKLKQLTKDTVLYGLSTIVGRFLNFLLIPIYTHYFRTGDYGVLSMLYSFIALLNIFFLFGMDSAYLKFAGTDESSAKHTILRTSLTPVFVVDVVFVLLLLVFRNQLSVSFHIPVEYQPLWYYVGGILILDSLSALPFISLRLQKKALRFSVIRISNILINIVLNMILILFFKMGIESVFISNLVASAFSFLVLLPDLLEFRFGKFSGDLFKHLLKFGLPYLPAGIASMFMQVIDRPIVERLKGYSVLGIYQANYRLGIFMMLYVSMFQFAWQPFFLENAKEKDSKQIFARVFTYFTAIGAVVLVVISFFIADVAKIEVHHFSLIGRNYWSGLSIVPIVLLAYLLNGFYINFSAGLFIKEKSIIFPFIMAIGAIANVDANFLLVPKYGITGAAIATLISYFLMAVGFYIASLKIYPIKYEWNKISVMLVMIAVYGFLYYSYFDFLSSHFFVKLVLAVLFILILFVTRIFTIASLRELVRREVRV
jgi:O-antigen/teichoic acid export membrane protein